MAASARRMTGATLRRRHTTSSPLAQFFIAVAALLWALPAAAAPAAWRIAGKNGGEIALLGSMHVLRASDYPLSPLVDDLYSRADVLVMELDLDDPNLPAQQAALLKAATLPAGTLLANVVDDDLYRLAAERARELGVDLELLKRLKPWLVAITLLDVGMQNMGFESELGIEHHLTRKAIENGKTITGLESLAKQIGIFDDLGAHDQEAMLAQTIQELDEAESVMIGLVAAWRDGRLEEMTETLLADFADFPELYDTLVTQRNAAWTDQLEQLLDDGRHYLVVVGALHLTGRDNVIDRLAARGHRAVRVEQN